MVCYGSLTYTSFQETSQNCIGVTPRTRFMEHTYLNRAGWTLARCSGVLLRPSIPQLPGMLRVHSRVSLKTRPQQKSCPPCRSRLVQVGI